MLALGIMPQFLLYGLVIWSLVVSLSTAASQWNDFESDLSRRRISPPGPNEYKCSVNPQINPESIPSCLPNPCKNGGVCVNEGASLSCKCSVGFGGATCEERKGECITFGDPHYFTFNKQRFDFMGKGRFVLSEDCVDKTFRLKMLNDYCGHREDVTCLVELLIQFKGNIIRFYRGKTEIALNQKKYILTRPMCGNGFILRRVSAQKIILTTNFGLEIEWNGDRTIRVFVLSKYRGKTCGLCGNYGVNDNNCGEKGKCNENTAMAGFCQPGRQDLVDKCDLMLKPPFQSCNSRVDPNIYVSDCKFDVCRCDDPLGCLCSVFGTYSKDCADNGRVLSWRNGADAITPLTKCAKQCKAPEVFIECGSSCVRSCSDLSTREPCGEECVAECRCPKDQLLNSLGSCVLRVQCPCDFGGVSYSSGQSFKKGKCETCTCKGGLVDCEDSCAAKSKPCDSSPCKNGGTCTNDGDSYSCKCSQGYKGNACKERQPQPCDLSPCKNGGSCTNKGDLFSCQCTEVFQGATCEVGIVSCVKGNWVNNFDRKGWSACPKEYPFISGLERSLAPHRFMDFILHLEGAECCSTTAASYECTVVSLIGTIRRINTWNVCPGGYFLSSLYRNNGHYLNSIIQAKCCKSTDRPALYQNCYDEDVTDHFDHNDEGMKTCQRPGYYMTGFFKSNCNFLYCIEKFKCCSPSEIQVDNPCSSNPCKNGGKCFTVGSRFSCRCQPKFGGPTCEEERAVCEAQGDPHYTTFDRRRFNFMGVKCQYVFVQDCSIEKAFTVFTNNVPCGRGGASCVSAVKVQLHGKEILFTTAVGLVRIDGAPFRKFPVVGEGYIITLPDRNHVLLASDIGLEVSWNFRHLVGVAVSGKYKGKTCGLCGNYDGDGNNDRFSPADLKCEQKPANSLQCRPSWVTRIAFAKCDLVAKSRSPFSACHRTVDPRPFIEDCKYDACRCARPMSCVCASVAAYVQECAKNDVIINWRFGVDVYRPLAVCAQKCRVRGQSFMECGSSCAGTCRDLSNDFQCNEECVPVCSCPDGRVLNDRMQCVPVSQCPCSRDGKNYLPGQSVRVGKCLTCLCHNGGMYCTEEEGCITEPCDLSPCKNGGVCTNKGSSFSCKCTIGFIGATCEKEVPNLCKPNPCKNGGVCEVFGTRFSCRCKPQFGGATCEHGQSICEAHGDPHYTTFDKRKFNFMGICDYVFSEDCSGDKAFSVVTKNIACGLRSASCTAAVTVRIAGYEIKLSRAVRTAVVNGVKIRKFPIKRPGFVITNPVLSWLRVTTNIGLSVNWNCRTIVRVAVSGRYKGKTCGLCGNNDGNRANDVVDPKLPCAPKPGEVGCQPTLQTLSVIAKCNLMGKFLTLFWSCRSFVNPAQLIKDCKYDACRCKDPMQCVCAAFSTYSKQCSDNGKVLFWRFKGIYLYKPLEQCAKQCENVGEIFTECGSSCAQTCRDLSSDIQCNEECVPGCQCPKGQVLNDAKRCVTKAACPCHFQGKVVQPGENVEVGNCKTCTCIGGAMDCVDDRDCANKGPCDSLPCKNDGICSTEGDSFSCRCTDDYQGKTCEELKPQPCNSSPCKNGGLCSNEGAFFKCECEGNYHGKTCQERNPNSKPCDSSPCKNGARCTDKGSSFSCKCPPNFIGGTCEKEVTNPCKPNPCKNKGVCEVLGNRFSCRCEPQFGGPTCEYGQSICEAHGDPHYTTFDKRKFNFMGICDYVFAEDCSANKAFSVVTKNIACGLRSASCTAAVTVRIAGYEIKLSRAVRTAVVNGVKIRKFPIKRPGFVITNPVLSWLRVTTNIGLSVNWNCRTIVRVAVSGRYKEKTCGLCGNNDGNRANDVVDPKLPCAPKPGEVGCQPTLQTLSVIAKCNLMGKFLTPFWSCRSFVNPAQLIKDCKYDACRCKDPMQCVCAAFSTYSKQCSDNGKVLFWRFKGIYLYKPLEQCAKQCENVGEIFTECGSSCAQTCRDLSSDIQCNEECVPGCQCPNGQVLNDAKRCVPKAECPCPFEGKVVQPGDNVDVGNCVTCTCNNGAMTCLDDRECANAGPCDLFPCKNDGICTSEGNSFLCECTEDYQGKTCEEFKPTPCDSSPCKNGGVCSNEGETFLCECEGDHEGKTCEIEPKPCDSSPCKNGGICTNEGESFSCQCDEDFQGETCEVYKEPKPCDSSPCANGSICENSGINYVCKCTPDFTGKHCEESTCKDGKLDLLYVVDGSGSVRKRNFEKIKQFTQELSGRFDIGSDKTHVAFMQFGRASKTRLEFGLDEENALSDVNKAIDRIKYLRSRTETGDALRKAGEVFNGKNGDRPGVGNVLILFTDGQATDKNKKLQLEEAEKLKEQGVTIITVAMGREKTILKFRNALETMASKTSSGKKLQFEANFSELGAVLDSLVEESCQGQKCTVKEIVAKCDSSCALSCRDLARDANCGEECGTRCRCPKGELFNDHLKCVAVAECPCQHQGKEVGPGEQVAVGKCRTCTCTNGLMKCEDKVDCKLEPCDSLPCENGGTCSNNGDSILCECPENYQGLTCSEPKHNPCDSSPCKNGGTCDNEGDSFLCNCAEDFEGETCEDAKCKDTKLDLLLVVDGSGSVRKANFAKIKEFIERLNMKFDVGTDKTRIALLQFGEPVKTRIEFNLGEKNTLDEVNKGVTDMKYLRSQTATADALRKAREEVFNGQGGDRPDAPNVLILFTDGQATDKGGKNVQVEEAQKLKDDGVKVITVGMGVEKTISKFRSKLEEMASKASGSNKPLEFETEFEQLDSIANALVKEACNSAGQS